MYCGSLVIILMIQIFIYSIEIPLQISSQLSNYLLMIIPTFKSDLRRKSVHILIIFAGNFLSFYQRNELF